MKLKIRDFAKVTSGSTPSRSKHEEYFQGGTLPWVKTMDLTNGPIASTNERITSLAAKTCKPYQKGTVLVAMYGGFKQIGRTGLLIYDASINQALSAIDVNRTKCTPEYLIQYLNHNVMQWRRFAASSRKDPNITSADVRAFEVTLPPLSEQKAIADLLSTWDEAIEKTERLILAKERTLKGQIQKRIGEKCKVWPHVKPKKIFDTITEKNFPDEELLSVTQDRGVIPRSMLEGRVMSPAGTTAGYKLIKRGDFAISLRSFQGGIEYSNYQGIISPAYTVLRPKIELDTDFYRLFFKSYLFIEKYLSLAVIGIRDGKQISIPDFLSIKIPVPPIDEQKQIAETLLVSQHEIDLLKQLADKYKTQKRGLMQKMLTGEWRVKPEIVNQYEEA
jgi:type I restriction enzyme S subunit